MSVQLFEPIAAQRSSQSIFPLRENEPDYAKLGDEQTQERNRYGALIALMDNIEEAQSLNINGVSEKGFNVNRNKQHAFHFTADNCIGCHACESACSEKNNLPPHLSFRSVGYVEGGSYPDYFRMNISMACNHCDDPVCLKGCPTRAYTKHPEYGAVIQDPDICFGCGYCTWVCPYNAPQLDPVNGQVEKCNMCVDRLEVGLKPACVTACLGNALDFGVVENMPENRVQIDTRIPGFPDPEITRPNIRFQQTRTLPREMTRPDSAPIKYHRDDDKGYYTPAVDRAAKNEHKQWSLGRLSSRENPLVLFTLTSQAAIGLYMLLLVAAGRDWLVNSAALQFWGVFVCVLLMAAGLLLSASHLGKPVRFYRGFNNLRHSPMAREGLGAALFLLFAGLQWLCLMPAQDWWVNNLPSWPGLGAAAAVAAPLCALFTWVSGIATIYYMYRCYRIPARPFWDHWQTATAFIGNCLSLGAVAVGLISLLAGTASAEGLQVLSQTAGLGVLMEGFGLVVHARAMGAAHTEGAVSQYVQQTTFGRTYQLRNGLMGVNLALLGLMAVGAVASSTGLWLAVSISVLVVALVGRALFYVLVVPTTMPGAFFWKNKGFEQHARDIGLARNAAVGVTLSDH
jgi:DMSO reductase iron-sulfur subunit